MGEENVLGISCHYHDSAAAVLKEGELEAAAEEERFTRQKHDNSFPEKAAEYCLERAGLEKKDIDTVVFHEKPVKKFGRIMQTFIETFPRGYRYFRQSLPEWVNRKLMVRGRIREFMGEEFEGEIKFSEHHISHASAAYMPSPFEEAAVLTVDGVGESTTTAIFDAEGNSIEMVKKIEFPDSLGLLYSTVTSFLGFMVNNDEYKVMGLAPYGEPEYLEKLKEEVFHLEEDGSFTMNMEYFSFRHSRKMWSEKFEEEFGKPREKGEELTERDKNLAASLQKLTEETVQKLAEEAKRVTGKDNLCMSGGVALNSASNGKLRQKDIFENIWIQPAATDAGDALGAAQYYHHHVKDNPRNYQMEDVYLGPEYSEKEIENALEESGLEYQKLGEEEKVEKVAELLEEGKVVSLFQGRLEWGPRALGNRSILADPRDSSMVGRVNKKVKFREEFRPFAPTVLEDRAEEVFDMEGESPYMLFVFDVRDGWKEKIPAVTHVNGTSRIQTIREDINRDYYRIIEKFGERTGVPVVLNTSFNVKGEPIVNTPENAVECFRNSGMDYMLMENFLVG